VREDGGLLTVLGDVNGIALLAEAHFDEPCDLPVVLDHENPHRG
jgi:hypothetical protein